MRVNGWAFRHALEILHGVSSVFESKYMSNYFRVERDDGGGVRLMTTNGECMASIILDAEGVDDIPPEGFTTTTKMVKLFKLVKDLDVVELNFIGEVLEVRSGKDRWRIPRLGVEVPPIPEVALEDDGRHYSLVDWGKLRSYLSVCGNFVTGGLVVGAQPFVIFDFAGDKVRLVSSNGYELLSEEFLLSSSEGDGVYCVPYRYISVVSKVSGVSYMKYGSTFGMVGGDNWVLMFPLIDITPDWLNLYNKVSGLFSDAVDWSFVVGKRELTQLLSRLKVVADLSGVIKLVGGGIRVYLEPVEDGVVIRVYSIEGELLSEETLEVEVVKKPKDVKPLCVNTKCLQDVASAAGPSMEFNILWDKEGERWRMVKVNSSGREMYFTPLVDQ